MTGTFLEVGEGRTTFKGRSSLLLPPPPLCWLHPQSRDSSRTHDGLWSRGASKSARELDLVERDGIWFALGVPKVTFFSFPPKMPERWSKSFSQLGSMVGLAEAGGGRRPRLLTDHSLKTSSVRSHDPRILIRKRLIQLQLSSFSPLDRLKLFLNVWLIFIVLLTWLLSPSDLICDSAC